MIQDYYKKWKTYSNLNQFTQSEFLNIESGQNCGIVVKNFIDKTCISTLLENYNLVSSDLKSGFNKNEGVIYPESFSVLAHDNFDENILAQKLPNGIRKLNNLFSQVEVDGESLMEYLLNFLCNGAVEKSVEMGKLTGHLLTNEKAHYITIRELFTEKGKIGKHAEKDLQLYYKPYFNLLKLPVPHFLLSFFILLQKPTFGGNLNTHNQYFGVENQNDNIEMRYSPEINVGDLVIFNGSDTYHSIDYCRGNSSRITLGGFLSKKDKNYIMWS